MVVGYREIEDANETAILIEPITID